MVTARRKSFARKSAALAAGAGAIATILLVVRAVEGETGVRTMLAIGLGVLAILCHLLYLYRGG